MDNYLFTKNLNFKDEVTAVLNIQNLRILGSHNMNDMVSSYLSNISVHRPTIMIISLPGLFELLVKSRMPKAKEFQHWLYFIVLPTLYHNPQLVNQINDLNKQIDNLKISLNGSRFVANGFRNECIDLRKEKIKLNKEVKSLNEQIENDDNSFYDLVDICQRYKNLLDENGIYY